MKPRYIPPNLEVGDRCWLLRGVLLYEVAVSEVRTYLEGEPSEFTLYRIAADHDHERYLSDESSRHRNDLFLRPAERAQLKAEVENRIESLEYLLKNLEEEEDE